MGWIFPIHCVTIRTVLFSDNLIDWLHFGPGGIASPFKEGQYDKTRTGESTLQASAGRQRVVKGGPVTSLSSKSGNIAEGAADVGRLPTSLVSYGDRLPVDERVWLVFAKNK